MQVIIVSIIPVFKETFEVHYFCEAISIMVCTILFFIIIVNIASGGIKGTITRKRGLNLLTFLVFLKMHLNLGQLYLSHKHENRIDQTLINIIHFILEETRVKYI